MSNLITRRYTGFTVNARIIDKETEEISEVSELYSNTRIDENKARHFIEKLYPTKFVLSVSWTKYDKMYGMPIDLFVKFSAELDAKTRQILNPDEYNGKVEEMLSSLA